MISKSSAAGVPSETLPSVRFRSTTAPAIPMTASAATPKSQSQIGTLLPYPTPLTTADAACAIVCTDSLVVVLPATRGAGVGCDCTARAPLDALPSGGSSYETATSPFGYNSATSLESGTVSPVDSSEKISVPFALISVCLGIKICAAPARKIHAERSSSALPLLTSVTNPPGLGCTAVMESSAGTTITVTRAEAV